MRWTLLLLASVSFVAVQPKKEEIIAEETIFEKSKIGKNRNIVTTSECKSYSELEQFEHFLDRSCPKSYDPVCDDPIFDSNAVFDFRCQLSMNNEEVLLLNSSKFLELARLRDSRKRNWCMITMFFAHNCRFSAELAPSFNKLPTLYNNLLVVAIQGTEFAKLNFRYGISGTPTVLLWINGMAVSRMSTKQLNITGLTNFIGSHTDLLPKLKKVEVPSKVEESPEDVGKIAAENEKEKGVQVLMNDERLVPLVYTFLSFAICITTFFYHIRERLLLSPPVLSWMMAKFGAALCEDIYFLLYVDPPRVREAAQRQADAPQADEDDEDEEEEEAEFLINAEGGGVRNDVLEPLRID